MNKSLIAGIVFATATFGSSAVMAQTTPPTPTMIGNTPQVLDLTDGSGFFGDTFAMNNNGAMFADHFTFSVNGTMGMNFDAIVSSISRTADTGLDFSGLSLYRVGGGTGTGGTAGDTLVSNGTSLHSGEMDVWTLSSDNLTAGDYYVLVSGNLVSDTSASFGGAVMLAPVPEPETYGMMLAGLGVLGFLARRRKQAANQATA
ncbi:FxDxF family PEP-CTERM protein [Massilia aerilata]|uniref:FxDxF family PEP-CTERM protein n=1 Tax=Massilia aerilata TaxID=453817 RepID=A0ABW0RS12_9BURK